MITDDDVLSLFEQADPARTTDDGHEAPDAAGYLAALRTRSNNVTYIHPTENPPASSRRHRLAMVAAAAAVVLVIGALVLAARGDDEGREVPATVPSTVPEAVPATTSTTPPTSAPAAAVVGDPVARATAFLEAFGTGDPATVQSLTAERFVMRYSWPGAPFEGPLGEHAWLGESYQVGSSTNYVDPECSAVDESDDLVVVECETAMELALHRLTNTEGIGATVSLRVAADGVVVMDSAYARSFGLDVLRPFDEWREANRPDSLADDGNDPRTAEESLAFARTEAELVAEWVTWATTAVEDTFAAHNSGDVGGFLAGFDQSTAVLGVPPEDAAEVFSALMAAGQEYDASNCVPDSIDRGLAIGCDLVVRPPAHEFSGAEIGGTIRMIVSADGTMLGDGYTVERQPWIFNVAFEGWLLGEHPDVHAQVSWVAVGDVPIPSAGDQELVATYYAEFVAQSEVYPVSPD